MRAAGLDCLGKASTSGNKTAPARGRLLLGPTPGASVVLRSRTSLPGHARTRRRRMSPAGVDTPRRHGAADSARGNSSTNISRVTREKTSGRCRRPSVLHRAQDSDSSVIHRERAHLAQAFYVSSRAHGMGIAHGRDRRPADRLAPFPLRAGCRILLARRGRMNVVPPVIRLWATAHDSQPVDIRSPPAQAISATPRVVNNAPGRAARAVLSRVSSGGSSAGGLPADDRRGQPMAVPLPAVTVSRSRCRSIFPMPVRGSAVRTCTRCGTS